MKHVFFLGLAVAAFLTAFAVGAPDGGKPNDVDAGDAKAVQGMWMPTKAELGGQPMPPAVLKTISLKMEEGKYEVVAGDVRDKGTYTLDSTSKPKGITVTGTEGPNAGKTYPAIYQFSGDEVKGDTLLICYDLSGEKRPTEFKSVEGTQLYLVTYSRKKE